MSEAAILAQRDIIYTAAAANTTVLKLSAGETCLCFAPIFRIAGEDVGLIFPIFAGATCVLMARWDTLGFMQAAQRHGVSQAWMLVDSVDDILATPTLRNTTCAACGKPPRRRS